MNCKTINRILVTRRHWEARTCRTTRPETLICATGKVVIECR